MVFACRGVVVAALAVAACTLSGVHANKQRWGKIQREYSLRDPIADYLGYWRIGGSCETGMDRISFKPQHTKRSGYFWSTKPVAMQSWEVTLEFNVNGPSPVNTGEGLAFWHVSDPGVQGEVYGHSDTFNGLGIFFDSYDSDGDNIGEPYVLAMYNDGTKSIDAEGAGVQLGVCFADYRNLPYPARAKISFSPDNGGHLTVGLDVANTGKFKSCISVKDVKLRPEVEYFGLTVSDYGNNFDVYTFLGVDTSERFEPGMGGDHHDNGMHAHSPAEAVVPEDSEPFDETNPNPNQHGGLSLAEQEHFAALSQELQNLDEKLFVIEDEFGKQFASVFHSHNTNFQHYLSNVLQMDFNDKHTGLMERVGQISSLTDSIRTLLGEMRMTMDTARANAGGNNNNNNNDSDETVDNSLTQMANACVDDTSRGQQLVAALKDSVATLKNRQEDILTNVHNELQGVRGKVSNACGPGSGDSAGSMALALLIGVAVGFGLAVFAKRQSGSRY